MTLQAGTRGYLTRKKVTAQLEALRKKKRLKEEKEKKKTQAAIAIQALWRGYRWAAERFSAL